MTRQLLVTNDFPPQVGGIQSYLWELWRRLPADAVTVLTTAHPAAATWDRDQPFRIERVAGRVLLPTPGLARRVGRLAADVGAEVVILDPVLPLGLIGPQLGQPYGVVVHGAEVALPGRLPVTRPLLARVLRRARLVVAAGSYPAHEAARAAGRAVPVAMIPPGVDTERFRPLGVDERAKARAGFGLPPDGRLVVGVSRLVPRKGFDVVIRAVRALAETRPDLILAVGGAGRDRVRLERLARRLRAPVRFLGRVDAERLPDLYGCADVFAMACRNRWAGLEQEGFGIVFVEAAAAGVPQVAGDSGGAAEAVVDGETGLVVRRPRHPDAVASALARLLDDRECRMAMGEAARRRAVAELSYEVLAERLGAAIDAAGRVAGG